MGKKAAWPASLQVFRDALAEAILSFPENYQIEGGPKVRATDIRHVREIFYKTYIVKSDAKQTPEQRAEARKKAFNRCTEKAQSAKLMAGRVLKDGREVVWLVSTGGAYTE
jgi:hypothetical protein